MSHLFLFPITRQLSSDQIRSCQRAHIKVDVAQGYHLRLESARRGLPCISVEKCDEHRPAWIIELQLGGKRQHEVIALLVGDEARIAAFLQMQTNIRATKERLGCEPVLLILPPQDDFSYFNFSMVFYIYDSVIMIMINFKENSVGQICSF
jgi:hypothetical protein